MKRPLTIKQIASLSGVSAGTVDRILHNRGKVSQEAYDKVQEVLSREEYKFNIHTSAVSLKKTYTIVVAIPYSEKGEYWDLIRQGIDKAIAEYRDISIICRFIFFDQFSSVSCEDSFASIHSLKPSAVIVGTTFIKEATDLCKYLENREIPYVLVDGAIAGVSPVATFSVNQTSCGRLLARLVDAFTSRGTIALMNPRREGTDMSNNARIRTASFEQFFEENGRSASVRECLFSASDPARVKEELAALMSEHPDVKGFAVVTSAGYLISDALQAIGASDVHVGCFDVTANNARCLREGTLDFVIDQSPEYQGFHAVESLIHFLLYRSSDFEIPDNIRIGVMLKENLAEY